MTTTTSFLEHFLLSQLIPIPKRHLRTVMTQVPMMGLLLVLMLSLLSMAALFLECLPPPMLLTVLADTVLIMTFLYMMLHHWTLATILQEVLHPEAAAPAPEAPAEEHVVHPQPLPEQELLRSPAPVHASLHQPSQFQPEDGDPSLG